MSRLYRKDFIVPVEKKAETSVTKLGSIFSSGIYEFASPVQREVVSTKTGEMGVPVNSETTRRLGLGPVCGSPMLLRKWTSSCFLRKKKPCNAFSGGVLEKLYVDSRDLRFF